MRRTLSISILWVWLGVFAPLGPTWGVWPRFEILIESILFNEEDTASGELLELSEVATRAVEVNLDLLAQRYGLEAGAEDIREARASLRPQVSVSLTTTQLDRGGTNVAAGAAERSTNGALAVAIIFGLAFATMLTLLVVPVLYSLMFQVSFRD